MLLKATGIFFHYQRGERLKDFPDALDGILERDNVFLFDAFYPTKPRSSFELDPVPVEALQKVHAKEMVERVRASGAFEGACYSAAGTVAAGFRICSEEISNAFVFTGYGDHHAGTDFFGGGCYFNGAAIAIHDLRKKFKVQRFAVIDTDPHHGDGSWDIFQNDHDTLYACFCSGPTEERDQNVNVQVPLRVTDDHYLEIAKNAFEKWITPFRPEIIFWNWGYDGTMGEYGDIGLSPDFHPRLAAEIKSLAIDATDGRLIVILCGGSRRDLATSLIPRIIKILVD
ncbi:hypothetical protein ACFL9T_23575 [Thermodesulfobacteriota bacterium]